MFNKILSRICCAICIVLGIAATNITLAGPIFLTGHDPDFHAQSSVGAQNLLTAGLNYVTGNTAFSGTDKFLWVESRISPPGGHLIGENGLAALGLSLGTNYDRANAAEFSTIIQHHRSKQLFRDRSRILIRRIANPGGTGRTQYPQRRYSKLRQWRWGIDGACRMLPLWCQLARRYDDPRSVRLRTPLGRHSTGSERALYRHSRGRGVSIRANQRRRERSNA